MPARVLHYVPWAIHTPHFETDLELIQEQLDRGSTVHVLVCNAALPDCDQLPEGGMSVCAACVVRRHEGLAALDRRRGQLEAHAIINLTTADRVALSRLPMRFESLEVLERFTFSGFDVGLAVISSLVSLLRNPKPCTREHAARIHGLVLSVCAVHLSTLNWIRQLEPDQAFVFNARFATHRAFFRACEAASVPCATHDRGATLDRYALFEAALPHSRRLLDRRIREGWAAAPRDEARAVGARFFEDRAKGVSYNFFSYTGAQDPSLLPAPWVDGQTKIAVFLSSEDEFVAIGPEWRNSLYGDQWRGLFAIIDDMAGDPRFHLYVRCHPNSANVVDANFDRLAGLAARQPRLSMIPALSPISTYRLLRSADRVLSFGSTVGIEATYWRKPSIVAGPSIFGPLGGVYEPTSHAAVLELLRAEHLPPADLEAALMYGYDQSTYGTPFTHFEATGVSTGRFRGRELSWDRLVTRGLRRLWRIPGAIQVRERLRGATRAVAIARLFGSISEVRRERRELGGTDLPR